MISIENLRNVITAMLFEREAIKSLFRGKYLFKIKFSDKLGQSSWRSRDILACLSLLHDGNVFVSSSEKLLQANNKKRFIFHFYFEANRLETDFYYPSLHDEDEGEKNKSFTKYLSGVISISISIQTISEMTLLFK